jgi:hypothetical protein
MSGIQQLITTPLRSVQLWFDRRDTPYALALVRIALPMALLVGVIPRWFHVREIYSSGGSPAPFWENFGHLNLLPILPPVAAIALYSAMAFCLMAISLGWQTRLSCLVVALLYPYFGLIDSLGTTSKYTVIGTHLMLLLACSNCGAVWSVDAWLASRRHAGAALRPPRFPVWPQRLIQFLIGFVYLGAAATKLHTPAYFNGDQLSYWMLTNPSLANPLGEQISQYSALLVIGAYVTLVWEILFIFLVWRGPWRGIILTIGLGFHLMTWLTLGLIVFPLVFVAAYAAFLTEAEARRIGRWCVSLFESVRSVARIPSFSGVRWSESLFALPSFLSLMLLVPAAAVTAEARMDVYRQRGPDGPPVLQPLPAERVEELLRNDQRLHSRDKVFSFDIGTTLVSGLLADRRERFRHGDRVLAQCRLIHPHEDLWVEVNLHDANNRIITRNGQVAVREESKSTLAFPMTPALAPGDYSLVLKIDGLEVARRRFQLIGR